MKNYSFLSVFAMMENKRTTLELKFTEKKYFDPSNT